VNVRAASDANAATELAARLRQRINE